MKPAMLLRSLLGIALAIAFTSCKSKTDTASTAGSSAYGGSGGSDDFYQSGGSGNSSGGGEYDYVYDQNGGSDPYAGYSGDDSSYSYETDSGSSSGSSSSSGGGSSYSAPTSSARYYTVQKGDTLYRISQNHGSSVAAIQDANNINGTLIRPGEQLVIP